MAHPLSELPALSGSMLTTSAIYANDTSLAGADRRAVKQLSKQNVVAITLAVAGMLFVWLLPLTALAGLLVLRRTLVRRRFLQLNNPILLRVTVVLAAITALLGLADFALSIWLAVSRGFATSMYWWGVAMIPASYPVFIASIIIGSIALKKSKQGVHKAAWQTLVRASEQRQSITSHYRISQRRVVSAVPVEADISVYVNPDSDCRARLLDAGIEETMLEDALDPMAEAQIEFRGGHMSAIVRWPNSHNELEQSTFSVSTCGVFLFANRLIIVLSDVQQLFEGRFFERVDTLQDVVVQLLRKITNNFETNLKRINPCS